MYEKAFHGKISCLITYGEANDPAYNPLLKDNQKEYIYHSELVLGDQRIIMSDQVDMEFQTCYPNFLTVMYDTKEEVQRAYEIMKEGSKTIYQMEATPYSSCRVVFVGDD
ncbi:MAG: VOC family protein [Lachnospiraceae bacterium]|nr:VOC family protein [Lachnospiraceae bacterium]